MSATEAPTTPNPSRAGRLLNLVRALINYGRQLAATLRSNPRPPAAGDIALILARITRGLLRAEALEARVIRAAPRLDAEPAPPRAPVRRHAPPANAAARPTEAASAPEALVPALDPATSLPTLEKIAAEIRRRPIGAVIADICRDLGIMPKHPLWPELRDLIIRYGGNLASLVKNIIEQAFRRFTADGPHAWPAAALQSPAPSGAGPP